MKALSLWQPHALAIGVGLKAYETRGWATDYRGPIAVHAAKRPWTDEGPWHTEARRILQEYVAKHGPTPWSFGAVVCTADLVSCVRTIELRGRILPEHEFWGDFSDGEDGRGRYAFKLENVKMLDRPFYCRGMQGWFEVDLGADERALAAPVVQQLGLFDMFAATLETAAVPAAFPAAPALPMGSPEGCEASRVFARACENAGLQYRGYQMDGTDRIYLFSAPAAPAIAYRVPFSMWDGSVDALLRKVGEGAMQ